MIISVPLFNNLTNVVQIKPDDVMQELVGQQGAWGVGESLSWHTGVHIESAVDNTTTPAGYYPVRAIADGVVVVRRAPRAREETNKDHPLMYGSMINADGTLQLARWTDDGVVVIKHTTDIGEGVNATQVVYYSIYMHLSELDAGLPAPGERVWRKTVLGRPGKIRGEEGRIHFEIVSDDANFQKIVGRATGDLNIANNGRTDAMYGDVYFHIPAGTLTFAQQPADTVNSGNVPATNAPTPTTEEIVVRMHFERGNTTSGTTANANANACVMTVLHQETITSSDGQHSFTDWRETGTPVREPGYEYGLYERAVAITNAVRSGQANPAPNTAQVQNLFPCYSAVFDLLFHGRVVGLEQLGTNRIAHWRKINIDGINEVWIDLGDSANIKVFTDGDFPHFGGWSIIDDDQNRDCMCESDTVLTWRRCLAGRDLDFLNRVSKAIIKAPSDWETANIDQRWGWMLTLDASNPIIAEANNQQAGTATNQSLYQNHPLIDRWLSNWLTLDQTQRQEEYDRLKAHIEALAFWSTAHEALPDAQNCWHYPPRTFIAQMQKCGWLSESEMTQLLPTQAPRSQSTNVAGTNVTVWVIDPVNIRGDRTARIQRCDVALNKACRRFGVVTPKRIAAFYANSMQETNWFNLLSETGNHYYDPWLGRGFIQLTWPSNALSYWQFIGQYVDRSLRDDLLDEERLTRFWNTVAAHNELLLRNIDTRTQNRNILFQQIEPRIVTAGLNIWRDSLSNDRVNTYPPTTAAGFYWAKNRVNLWADRQPINTRHTLTNTNAQAIANIQAHYNRRHWGAPNTPASFTYHQSNGIDQVNRAVNTGDPNSRTAVNGAQARFYAYENCQTVLMDTMKFANVQGVAQDLPEDFTNRRP